MYRSKLMKLFLLTTYRLQEFQLYDEENMETHNNDSLR